MTSISSNPYSYISSLLNPTSSQAGSSASNASSIASELDSLIDGSTNESDSSNNSITSLLGSGSTGKSALSSSVLSALQEYQQNDGNGVASLFGGDTSSLTGGVEDASSVYNQALQTAYAIAGVNSDGSSNTGTGTTPPAAPTQVDPLQAALSSRNTAINAYNTTLLNQAKTVLANNSLLTA